MAHVTDQTESHTDAFPLAPPTRPAKPTSDMDQKKVLGVSAAALLLGGAAWAVAQKIQTTTGEKDSDGESGVGIGEPFSVELPADIEVARNVTDEMSFDKAFAAARGEVGMGGVFSWHGRWFNTFEKEEWGSLSLEQRKEYTEQVLGEKLPIKTYNLVSEPLAQNQPVSPGTEPTVIEGFLNGQRVMGLDFDQDGIIDSVVLDGADGYAYSVVDASGNAGLDTLYQYDTLSGEIRTTIWLDEPFVLTNDDFSQALENTMSQEIIDSILEPDAAAPVVASTMPEFSDGSADAEDSYVGEELPEDDTYVNDGDVRDMDQ
ncbi:hypothetical protein ACO2Q8_21660 [Larkinella sp. VNQ87]|uniref:hypothetical protein n=1 Tax=Larkinella sp. VNQ87 TaxID=3400921 RepID=UPI003C03D6B3